MVNVNKLKGRIVENGTTIEEMAKSMGVVPSTIYRKLQANGESFTIKEADEIVRFLHLNAEDATAIFLANMSRKCDKESEVQS